MYLYRKKNYKINKKSAMHGTEILIFKTFALDERKKLMCMLKVRISS
jgi:hypothetical protein